MTKQKPLMWKEKHHIHYYIDIRELSGLDGPESGCSIIHSASQKRTQQDGTEKVNQHWFQQVLSQ